MNAKKPHLMQSLTAFASYSISISVCKLTESIDSSQDEAEIPMIDS